MSEREAGADLAPYTLRTLQQMLGLGRSVIMNLVAAGFVTPTRGRRNEYRFSFQDLVLLRTAHQLRQASVPPRKLLRALRQLRARLPRELPMSGLRIRAVGSDVAVKDGGAQWDAQSGQLLLDLEVLGAGGAAVLFRQREPASARKTPKALADAAADGAARTAGQWLELAAGLEASDPRAAEAAYRQAVAQQPDLAEAHVNLGALLCEQQRWADALAVFDAAILPCPGAALLHFNRGIALEELARQDAALDSYLNALQLDVRLADAHYNAARLLEARGQPQRALAHYSAYRRLQPRS